MKYLVTLFTLLVCSLSAAFAGDKAPTVLTNSEAIGLVQSRADYVWTLVCAVQIGRAHV